MTKRLLPAILACLLLVSCSAGAAAPVRDADQMSVSDYPAPEPMYLTPPLWYQDDPLWSGLPYGSTDIGERGCGLCCAASAMSYYLDAEVTPADLVSLVGDACLTADVNDMGLFAAYLEAEGVCEPVGVVWTTADALEYLYDGALVFAGVSGKVGSETYGGHVVLLWRSMGRLQMLDPKCEYNGGLTDEGFLEADWIYFYPMYGTKRVI